MYEIKDQPPISRTRFLLRLAFHGVLALGILLVSLLGGMAGYVYFGQLTWLDAFVNAAMLLGGMGPVNTITTESGKIFAGSYALYAGLVFLVTVGLMLAPVLHRILHRFHWAEDN